MLRNSSMPALARFILKAHTELSSVMDAVPPSLRTQIHPLLNLHFGNVDMSLGVNEQSNSNIHLACTQGEHKYTLDFKSSPDFKANAVLTNSLTGETLVLDSATLLRGEVPAAYQALHQEVLQHLKKFVPDSLWAQLSQAATKKQGYAESSGTEQQASGPEKSKAERDAANCPGSDSSVNTSDTTEEVLPTYVITRANEPDLKFTGKLLDAVRTSLKHGRWTEFHVYETKGGKFVGVKVGQSLWLNEVPRTEAKVTGTLTELSEFFGHNTLAKVLSARLGITQFEEIE